MTLKSIVTGVDFSATSRAALQFAGRLAHQCGAQLHVVYAEPALLAAAARERGWSLDSAGELAGFVTEACGPGLSPAPQVHTKTGAAAAAILASAGRLGADLIVVGSHGMSRAAHLMFGSTTERTLRRADRSVLVVPEGWQPPRPDDPGLTGVGPLIVGVDFSEPSVEAAGAACALASRLGAGVELVHAVPPLRVPGRWQAQADEAVMARAAEARRELDQVARDLPSSVAVRLVATDGEVPAVLAEAAAVRDGRHPVLVLGRRAQADGRPGAIAYQTLTVAKVPVLMHVAP